LIELCLESQLAKLNETPSARVVELVIELFPSEKINSVVEEKM